MPASQTATTTPQPVCTYPLVGVDALFHDLQSRTARLAEVTEQWRKTFSFAAQQRRACQKIELAVAVHCYSLVTGQPESDIRAQLAA